jgi:DNA-binding transcriptional MerR regulator
MPGSSKTGRAAFHIAEVAALAGVKPHVLRYWETEFPQLDPEKNASGQRIYRQKDLNVVLHLKRLLYEEQYTIAGARKRLQDDLRDARRNQMPLALNLEEVRLAEQLVRARRKIKGMLEMLEKEPGRMGQEDESEG